MLFDDVQVIRNTGGSEIDDNTIATQALVDAAITDVKLATASVTTTKIRDDSVTTPKLVALSVTAAKIAALSITADKISVATLSAISVNVGEVTAGTITGLLFRTGASYPRIELNSSGFRSYDAGGVVYYEVSPMTIGTKVYGYEWRMHPNIPVGSSMIFGGHHDKGSNILLYTADGTAQSARSALYMVHGGAIELHTNNAKRAEISAEGGMLFTGGPDYAPSSGVRVYDTAGTYLSWWGAGNPIGETALTPNRYISVKVNGRYLYLAATE
jgi:hypothetical protein